MRIITCCSLFLLFTADFAFSQRGPYVGRILGQDPAGRDFHYIEMNPVAMDRFEHGTKATNQFELWKISCAEHQPGRCQLRRTVFFDPPRKGLQYIINEHVHKAEDGEFTIIAADWKAGRLEFRVNYGNGADDPIADCLMLFKLHGSMLFLEDLRAALSKRPRPGRPRNEELEAVEYRVAPYEETRLIPVQCIGLLSALEKDEQDMEQTLSESDRRIWQANKQDIPRPSLDRALPGWQETLKKEKRPLSDDERQMVRDFFYAEVRSWLKSQGVSPEGCDKIVGVYRKNTFPDF
ncbi:MAG: hypothetical protein EHM61_24705 [Acidobacteria bacterium]|nr:MAG: hypothetical protein EHM61_24705 [Acidobacteriota bacterium]